MQNVANLTSRRPPALTAKRKPADLEAAVMCCSDSLCVWQAHWARASWEDHSARTACLRGRRPCHLCCLFTIRCCRLTRFVHCKISIGNFKHPTCAESEHLQDWRSSSPAGLLTPCKRAAKMKTRPFVSPSAARRLHCVRPVSTDGVLFASGLLAGNPFGLRVHGKGYLFD